MTDLRAVSMLPKNNPENITCLKSKLSVTLANWVYTQKIPDTFEGDDSVSCRKFFATQSLAGRPTRFAPLAAEIWSIPVHCSLSPRPLESAIVRTLPPDAYTAIV